MGKKKVDVCKFLEDQDKRDVTFSKRKRGIIKKIIELSRMCGQDIFMVIFDKSKQKIVEYRSEAKFGIQIVNALLHKEVSKHFVHQSYTNADFEKITSIKPRKSSNDGGENSDGEDSQDDENQQNVKQEDSPISKLPIDENEYRQDDPL